MTWRPGQKSLIGLKPSPAMYFCFTSSLVVDLLTSPRSVLGGSGQVAQHLSGSDPCGRSVASTFQ